ncbi:hypothetical protein Poli38472_009543 [Pythium oligandrum]|uniref:Major facilitator superfamily (MFS) profile domain-containing protein n=1 Tax=Pythium oligandrum TaxID=41045 RepID=A0A8K1CF38_PYTOL|nr:hypothetical protein Poli38472_009543 [Pythium oligandrum]|eukprot:TMW62050.1 hypothetical protein Poli38472_009543 [Pythium oligandrum]
MLTSDRTLDERGVILLLCYINFLNYLDRGIIPGAPESFQHFMTETLGITGAEQSWYLGLLTSAFIASTATCSLIFGVLAIKYRPFFLIAIGMASWIFAVFICGLAHSFKNYYLLLFGRFLSGVGEASFHCNAMPFINRHAPKENSTVWLGIFIASISVGMSAGYVYGAVMASSSMTWAGAFYIEALLMAPPVLVFLYYIPDDLNQVPRDKTSELPKALLDSSKSKTESPAKEAESDTEEPLLTQSYAVLAHPTFMLVALGHAAYTFSLSAFSIFCPVILIGMGMFTSEREVSFVFGAVMAIGGTIGTVVGGVVLDQRAENNTVPPPERARLAIELCFYLMIATVLVAMIMLAFMDYKVLFLVMLAATFFFIAAIGPAESVAVMELFPESHQAIAVAANTVLILVLGDVPSPLIIGWLKDTWAPRCGTVEIEGKAQLDPSCYKDRSGINGVLLFAVLWMLWAVLLWGAGKYLAKKDVQRPKATTIVAETRSPVQIL